MYAASISIDLILINVAGNFSYYCFYIQREGEIFYIDDAKDVLSHSDIGAIFGQLLTKTEWKTTFNVNMIGN